MPRALLNPFTLGFAGAALVAALFSQWPLAALAFIVAIGNLAILSIKETSAKRAVMDTEDLSNEDRTLISPIRRLRNEIDELVQSNKQNVSISVVGAEALGEADHILKQTAKTLALRRQLKKSAANRTQTARELDSLRDDISRAESPEERATLQAALEARETESSHYENAAEAIEHIDSHLRQAEAALSEMKARLATAAAGTAGAAPATELEETIGRLKSLGTSLEESEQWLKEQA